MLKDKYEFLSENDTGDEDDGEIRKYDHRDPDRDLYDENGNISQETFYSSDENGSWEGNVVFNGDGRPVDADGRVIGNDDDFAMFLSREDDYEDDDEDDDLYDVLAGGLDDDEDDENDEFER